MAYENFINQLKNDLPELCTVKDLVKAGIFTSVQQASTARKNKKSPSYIQYPTKRIIYSKDAVIEYVQKNLVICP